MSEVGDTMERIHRQILSSTKPMTMMITTRKLRIKELEIIAGDLDKCVEEIRELIKKIY